MDSVQAPRASRPLRTLLVTLAIVPMGAFAACGSSGSSDSDKVKEVAQQLATADPKVCDNVTDAFLKQVGGTRDACRKGAKASKQPNAKVGAVKVDGDKATAKLSQGKTEATISFAKDGDTWKVSGAR